MIRSTTPRIQNPRRPIETQSATRDVAVIFALLTLAWATTSCASSSVHEICAKAESWDTFGSYEDCMAAKGDPSRAPAMSEDELGSTPVTRARDRKASLQRR